MTSSCISLGQIYVVCSRVGSPMNLFILASGGDTNIPDFISKFSVVCMCMCFDGMVIAAQCVATF